VRAHTTLRATPAIAAGVADKLCDVGDIVAILEKMAGRQLRRLIDA